MTCAGAMLYAEISPRQAEVLVLDLRPAALLVDGRPRQLDLQPRVALRAPDQVPHAVRVDALLEQARDLLGQRPVADVRRPLGLLDLVQQARPAGDVDARLEVELVVERHPRVEELLGEKIPSTRSGMPKSPMSSTTMIVVTRPA